MPLLAAMLLAACGGNEKVLTDEQQEVEDNTASEDVEQSTEEDLTLTKVGEMVDDPEVGTLVLESKRKVNEDIVQGGLTIHLDEVKVITINNMLNDFKDKVELNTGKKPGNELTYMQVSYSFKNTSDDLLSWSGFATAIKEDGEQLDLDNNDIIGNQNPSQIDIQPKATVKDNLIGIPVDKDIKSIRLVSDDVLKDDNEAEDFIVQGEETTISLN
ncbi:hypothetical protein [Priestia megaterium]